MCLLNKDKERLKLEKEKVLGPKDIIKDIIRNQIKTGMGEEEEYKSPKTKMISCLMKNEI